MASLIAFWAGEFANSYTMARLKLLTNGSKLWTRTIGSTMVGQAVDTTLVIVLTFAGTYSVATLVKIIYTGYLLKVAYEVIATPLTYMVINWLKNAEHADAFDRERRVSTPFEFSGKEPSFHSSNDAGSDCHWRTVHFVFVDKLRIHSWD